MEDSWGPAEYLRELRDARQAFDDARHSLTFALDAPHGVTVGLPSHSPYNRLTILVNDFRDAYARYRDALKDGSDAQMRLQADYSEIQSRAAQTLLDISPYDLPPEE